MGVVIEALQVIGVAGMVAVVIFVAMCWCLSFLASEDAQEAEKSTKKE